MNKKQENYDGFSRYDQGRSHKDSALEAIIIVAIIAFATLILGLVAASIFTTQQMYIVRPMLAAIAVFIIFSIILKFRIRTNIFGEIGFIYLAISLAYTILPAIKFLMLDLNFPLDFDWLHFAVLSPQPAELGTHFWRHVLFISGVAAGYLVVRGRQLPLRPLHEKLVSRNGRIIAVMIAIMGLCLCALMLLSAPVTTYIENYTRFDHLSWTSRRFVSLCLIFKSGGYFVLLALMFSQYRKYKMLIFIIVPIVCIYEVVYSIGSRIVAFTILMAFLGFYHYRVSYIRLKKAIAALIILAIVFIGIEIVRSSNYNSDNNFFNRIKQKQKIASEFEAVYCTGFHLYVERAQKTLPPRDWEMFFFDFISFIPFLDHITNKPQYWYARNYYPYAVVPPTTMGVIAESAIWGGELDLLVRSLLNGAIFGLLTWWFLRRREKWWASAIYIYCYAMCVMTLKYSVLYQLSQLFLVLLPPLLLAGILFRSQKSFACLKSFPTEPVA
jgi:hypothetical protein